MRQEPRRLRGIIRAGFTVFVIGFAVFALEGLMPQLRAQTPDCVAGVQQAEAGVLTGFEVAPDATADGGAFIHVPEGTANRWTPSDAYRASYCFTVATAGRYRVAAVARADGGTSDSFFVAVDGLMVDSGRWDVAPDGAFGPDYVNAYQAADPVEVDLIPGDHTVDVYLREDGTRLDSLALEPLEGAPTCEAGWVQAEDGRIDGFTVVQDRAAKGRAAIEVPDGTGSAWFPSAAHRAAFCLEAKRDGVYRIEAEVHAPSTTSDSFFVRVDGGDTVMWFPPVTSSYSTDYVNAYGQADPVELQLSAGPHAVEVFLREDGTRLDRIRLSEKESPRGRDCRQSRYEAEDVGLVGFEVGKDPAASNGAYIHVPDGTGSSWSPSDAVMATFCLEVRQAGRYRLVGGVWADRGTNDSFWVKVDGAVVGRWDVAWNTGYGTDVVGFNNGADPLLLDFEAGDHVVEVMLREDGTRLDWLGIEVVGQ